MQSTPTPLPFNRPLLDNLMEQAELDVLIASSKPNVQYLLGGHRCFFFEHAPAIGQSRYLPLLAYVRREPERSFYVGHAMEQHQLELSPFWVPDARPVSNGSADAMRHACGMLRHVASLAARPLRIGAELAFLPADATAVLRDAFPDAALRDALPMLERLRARKSPVEIDKLRYASDAVIASMLAVTASHGPGTTKRALVEALRREQVNRGLDFDYCLITAGTSLNRAPSNQEWREGDILSLDSGGNCDGYIGDVCRMAILGEPDAELCDLLAEVDTIQQAAIAAVRPGLPGGEVYHKAELALERSPNRSRLEFIAHGMGLVSHEVPHLTGAGPVPYPATDAGLPLEAGMVLSVETTLQHETRGFIKLEDTVLVLEDGNEVLGTAGRGWNRGGVAVAAPARTTDLVRQGPGRADDPAVVAGDGAEPPAPDRRPGT